MKTLKTALMIGCVAAATFILGACRDDEQGRPLGYDKGNYAGKPDTPLSDEARRAIQDRVHYQAGGNGGGGSSGTPGITGVSSSADVRPPGVDNEGAK